MRTTQITGILLRPEPGLFHHRKEDAISYSLSFSADFWGAEEAKPSDRPTSVCQAVLSLPPDEWAALARDVFHCPPDNLDVQTVLHKIQETDTCENLDPPVRVYIDPEGYYSILVYDKEQS